MATMPTTPAWTCARVLDRSCSTAPMGSNAHRSRLILDVSSFTMVSVLSFYSIRVRALCVEEPQLGCISSACTHGHRMTLNSGKTSRHRSIF